MRRKRSEGVPGGHAHQAELEPAIRICWPFGTLPHSHRAHTILLHLGAAPRVSGRSPLKLGGPSSPRAAPTGQPAPTHCSPRAQQSVIGAPSKMAGKQLSTRKRAGEPPSGGLKQARLSGVFEQKKPVRATQNRLPPALHPLPLPGASCRLPLPVHPCASWPSTSSPPVGLLADHPQRAKAQQRDGAAAG